MKEEVVKAYFTIAGIEVKDLHQLANKYWPDCEGYEKIRRENPWWLVETKYGLIEIGHRKRVFAVDWNSTSIRKIITADDVTKNTSMVHAWTEGKLLEYLIALGKAFNDVTAMKP